MSALYPRKLVSHKVAGLNDALAVYVLDEAEPGQACHEYEILDGTADGQAFDAHLRDDIRAMCLKLHFQAGPIHETGINGVSNEALLAIVEDRLLGFQAGFYQCRENEMALTKIQEAMAWLHKRTRDRVARGVDGTSSL